MRKRCRRERQIQKLRVGKTKGAVASRAHFSMPHGTSSPGKEQEESVREGGRVKRRRLSSPRPHQQEGGRWEGGWERGGQPCWAGNVLGQSQQVPASHEEGFARREENSLGAVVGAQGTRTSLIPSMATRAE